MKTRIFPHPGLSVTLVLVWLILSNGFSLGSLVLGLVLGVAIPMLTREYWPHSPRLRNLPAFLAYIGIVMWDIVLSNVAVARIILFKPAGDVRSAFVVVPIDLRSPEGIAMLAATITLTPGTVSSDFSSCGRYLLVHALHAPDPDAIRNDIKTRYEARLKRIFE